MGVPDSIRRHATLLIACIAALGLLAGCSKQANDAPSARNEPADGADDGAREPVPSNQEGTGDTPTQSMAAAPPTDFAPFEMLLEIEAGAYDELHAVAFSPDGKTFVTAGGHVKFWDIGSAKPTADISEHFEDIQFGPKIKAAAFTPDGNTLALGCEDGYVWLWDVPAQELIFGDQIRESDLRSLSISHDGNFVAVVGFGDGNVQILDAKTGELVRQSESGQTVLRSVAFSPTRPQVAATDEAIVVWNSETGEEIHQLKTDLPMIWSVAYSPDGKTIAVGEGGWAIRLWDAETGEQNKVLKGHEAAVEYIAFSADGSLLASIADSMSIRLWDVASGANVQTIPLRDEDDVVFDATHLAWAREGALLAVTYEDGQIRYWGPPGALAAEAPADAAVSTAETTSEKGPEGASEQVTAVGPAEGAATAQVAVEEPGEPHEPPSVWDAISVLDLRKMPRMKVEKMGLDSAAHLYYETPNSEEKAVEFYRDELAKLGWVDQQVSMENRLGQYLEFRKDGYLLTVRAEARPASGIGGLLSTITGGGYAQVTVEHRGNYDARWLPRLAGATDLTGDSQRISYSWRGDPLQLEIELLKAFRSAGWHVISRISKRPNEDPDRVSIQFMQNGMTASIYAGAKWDQPDTVFVQCSAQLLRATIPVPSDVDWLEFDETGPPHQAVLTTKLDLQQAAAYYDEQMPKQGWRRVSQGEVFEDNKITLAYERSEDEELQMRLSEIDDATRIVVGVEPGYLDYHSWHVHADKHAAGQLQQEESTNGMQAADLQLPMAAEEIEYDRDDKMIEFKSTDSLEETIAFFKEQLSEQEWTMGSDGSDGDQFSTRIFSKDGVEIDVTAQGPWDGKCFTRLSGEGLLWSKELPTDKNVIAYETWLKRNGHPPTLSLLGEFEAAMHAK